MEAKIKEKDAEKGYITLLVDGKEKRFDKKQTKELCEKGLKYGLLEENYQRLISMAKADNLSVPDFLDALEMTRTENRKNELAEKCGGNEEMALHIIQLEATHKTDRHRNEFKEYFPNIDIEQLPQSVKEKANINNRSLLDEFLRYNAKLEKQKKENEIKRKENEISATGSLKSLKDISFEGSEFLKGIWR